jgi:hypothetical protein
MPLIIILVPVQCSSDSVRGFEVLFTLFGFCTLVPQFFGVKFRSCKRIVLFRYMSTCVCVSMYLRMNTVFFVLFQFFLLLFFFRLCN